MIQITITGKKAVGKTLISELIAAALMEHGFNVKELVDEGMGRRDLLQVPPPDRIRPLGGVVDDRPISINVGEEWTP